MISELLAYDFMQRAILAVIAISIFSPILGLFLILRRQSLMSDTLSHVSLAGAVSYTHLDVYKRQNLYFSQSSCSHR